MDDHMRLCGQMVRAFGNDRFERASPFDEVAYVVENHDRGWKDYDEHPGLDPNTRLPYVMSQTPGTDALITNKGSPDFNEAHHPYCGLLSSMHTCGIYNGRYGFSQFKVPLRKQFGDATAKASREAMLQAESSRQERLKAVVAQNPASARWVENDALFRNFKQLQFFDTLSLYFHLSCPADRKTEVFIHVPLSEGEDATITLKKVSDAEYSLDPYPFAVDRLNLTWGGWYFHRLPADTSPSQMGAALKTTKRDSQSVAISVG
jgi:hypothetical protein